MEVKMEKWEVERVKEKISKILEFWMYDLISMKSSTSSHEMGLSTETFLEQLERELLT